MTKYNTKKRIFETILTNFPKKSTEILINIENTNIINIYENNTHIGFHIKSTTKTTKCKICNLDLTRSKGFNDIVVNYGKYNSKIILIRANLKKYHCMNCKATTIENLINKTGKIQVSNNVIDSIILDLKSNSNYTDVAKKYGESITNIQARFDKYRKNIEVDMSKRKVYAIGVDEVSMIKYVLKSTPSRLEASYGAKREYIPYNYQFVVIDHETGNIIDIINGRTKKIVLELVKTRYESVENVTMDLWKTYRDIFNSEFEAINVIADRFHVVRNFVWAFSRGRIDLFKACSITTTKHWKILTCRESKLDEKGKNRLEIILNKIPGLKVLHQAKEMALETFKKQELESFQTKYETLKEFIYDNELIEFYKAIQTVEAWKKEIDNMFIYSEFSNGKVERMNTALKKIKSYAYGFSNSERTFALVKHKLNKVS